jgi:ABC-2 type transport system ATP-binding protein
MNVIETSLLGKRYRSEWALRDCTLAIPAGHVVALVGPNGAGKTTLLHCAVGLLSPTSGTMTVLGDIAPGSYDALERIAFVAQDAPLYQQLSVRAMVEVAACLNQHFDVPLVERRLEELEIRADHRVGKLSGGQQAQLALALALARHPELLVLDEPLARLDPLARHDFMALVLAAVAEEGISVIFSSHVVSELERVADYLILLAHGQLQMAGDIEELLSEHALLVGPSDDLDRVQAELNIVHTQVAGRHAHLLVRTQMGTEPPSGWERKDVALEELVLDYLREPSAVSLPGPSGVIATRAGGLNR